MLIHRTKLGTCKRGDKRRLNDLVANKLEIEQRKVESGEHQATTVERPLVAAVCSISRLKSPQPQMKALVLATPEEREQRLYPLIEHRFFDQGNVWQAKELSDDYLLITLDVYADRVRSSATPSMEDKNRLRACEQELQRRTTPDI